MTPARRTLLAVIAACALPFAVPPLLHAVGWHPAGGKPHGELMQPPRPLPATLFAAPLGTATDIPGRWHLVVAGAGACDVDCRKLIDAVRRIQVALYKDMERVDRYWASDLAPDAIAGDLARLRQSQPDLHALHIEPPQRSALDLDQAGHRLYLVDPAGRVVMRYAADVPLRGVLEVLQRLLPFS